MNDQPAQTSTNRRDFIKAATFAGAGAAIGGLILPGSVANAAKVREPQRKPRETIRVGFVGCGGMGTGHIRNLLKIEGVELRAVCDLYEARIKKAQDEAKKAGKPEPVGYSKGPQDFRRMCDKEELDLVYTATPWEWHVPVCLAAMNSGKHAATEVPAAMTVEDCWKLVETVEKTGLHCQMMENCCYDRSELMVLNMVRQGLFGEIVHGEGGYMHDLRRIKFNLFGEGMWRRAWATKVNGNLYPTHGIGPLAWYMNINRGDRIEYLVSMSSNSRGLQEYAASNLKPKDERLKEKYVLGDVNSSLLRTANGMSIVLQHDCNLPRPYSRINLIQGTKGIFRGFPDQIHIEGRTEGHDWESLDKYRDEFDHPLYKAMKSKAEGAGHGGMDFIEDYRLIRALRLGIAPDQNVYDAATWSAIVELTAKSVGKRSAPVDFPDFTKGRWKTANPINPTDA